MSQFDETILVHIKQVETPNNFIASFGNTSYFRDFEEFEDELNEWCQQYNSTQYTAIFPHQDVLVHSKKSRKWKRATIHKIECSKINVYLIDEGLFEECSFGDIISDLPKNYEKFMPHARRCSIKNAQPLKSRKWSKDSCEYFQSNTINKKIFNVEGAVVSSGLIINSLKQNETLNSMDLYTLERLNGKVTKIYLLDKMIGAGHARPINQFEETEISSDSDCECVSISISNGSDSSTQTQFKRSVTIESKISTISSNDVIVIDDEPETIGRNIKTAKYPKVAKFAQNVLKKNNPSRKRADDLNYRDDLFKILLDGENGKLEVQPQQYICSDDTITTGYKRNIEFKPNYKELRSVVFNADFESADDEPLVDEEKQKRENEIGNQLYAILSLYDDPESNSVKAKMIIDLHKKSRDIKNCGEIILRCIIDQIASKQDFIDTAVEMLEILNNKSSFCNILSIRNALNFLRNKYVNNSANEIDEAKIRRFCKIVALLYTRACVQPSLRDVKEYATKLLQDWIQINAYMDIPDSVYQKNFKCVLEFLKIAVSELKEHDTILFETIYTKAKTHSQDNRLSKTVTDENFKIVDFYGSKFMDSNLPRDSMSRNSMQNYAQRHGKRKINFWEHLINID